MWPWWDFWFASNMSAGARRTLSVRRCFMSAGIAFCFSPAELRGGDWDLSEDTNIVINWQQTVAVLTLQTQLRKTNLSSHKTLISNIKQGADWTKDKGCWREHPIAKTGQEVRFVGVSALSKRCKLIALSDKFYLSISPPDQTGDVLKIVKYQEKTFFLVKYFFMDRLDTLLIK